MKLEKRLLIVDNNMVFIQGVKYIVETNRICKGQLKLDISHSYKNAFEKLNYFAKTNQCVDAIFLNIDINSREKIGLILTKNYIKNLRASNSNLKIILFSSRRHSYRIHYIIKNCNPNGFILDRDLNIQVLMKVFDHCFKSEIYYSKSIHKILNNFKINNVNIDEIDFHILYFLKLGLKSNYIQHYIPRSNSTIEKRKYKLKDEFAFGKCTDEQLVKQAIKRGIL